MTGPSREMIGSRGETIARLRLTNYERFVEPLFRPAFLGDKWEATDLLVELRGVSGSRSYFLAQVKSTAAALAPSARSLAVSATRRDVSRLLAIPGPTYLIGVHEPSERAFVRAVHAATPARGIARIPTAYELTWENLQRLHAEVVDFWSALPVPKPTASEFA